MLLTPGQAANLLQVRESWLRRRAAQRRVPCTFLGKHLRFSPADLTQIIAEAARPSADTPSTPPRGTRTIHQSPGRTPYRPPTSRSRQAR